MVNGVGLYLVTDVVVASVDSLPVKDGFGDFDLHREDKSISYNPPFWDETQSSTGVPSGCALVNTMAGADGVGLRATMPCGSVSRYPEWGTFDLRKNVSMTDNYMNHFHHGIAFI